MGSGGGRRGREPDRAPKKKQRGYYSGKKKRHTLKTQLLVDRASRKIVCITVAKGRKHDFRVFRESGVRVNARTGILADSGYQGIQHIHPNCAKPIKGSKKRPLTKADREHNHAVGSQRVMVEHVIRELKIFKIVAAPYRNRRKRFGLRMNLLAGIYNYEL